MGKNENKYNKEFFLIHKLFSSPSMLSIVERAQLMSEKYYTDTKN
jgi:hypothetical protein